MENILQVNQSIPEAVILSWLEPVGVVETDSQALALEQVLKLRGVSLEVVASKLVLP